jgi:hypothetical protein
MVNSTEITLMESNTFKCLTLAIAAAMLGACGGGGGGSTASNVSSAAQTGSVSMLVSDASTEDWATIGVKILSIALVPEGGGAHVTVYTAPTPAPTVNLAQLDQIAEILGNVSVPVGSYSDAILTVSANPGDVLLTVAASPEVGFAALPGVTIPSDQIQIQHTQGAAPNLTVPIDVKFVAPLTVTANQSNALDLEFDLAHPAFLVGHVPPASGGATLWAVNFQGPIRHHPLSDLPRLVLRHTYGSVSAIASDNASITITKEFPTEPAVNPETAVATSQSLVILADSTNGSILYDLDAKTRTVITDFSTETALVGKSVRIAARYQEDGTLVATRIWASSQFNTVYVSPEGHVLHVNSGNDVLSVQDESGRAVDLLVDANTQFFFRQPQNALADATPIGTGTAFLSSHDLVRGFKVHASVVDPLANPWVAQSVDIEVAEYDGTISLSNDSNFTYRRSFATPSDNYDFTLNYIDAATANGKDDAGNTIDGYKWWNFAFPTMLDTGSAAITDFVSATDGSVNFGGTVGAVAAHGVSFATWNDPANPDGWSAAASILTPSTLPLGLATSGLVNDAFTMTVLGGANAATVAVNSASGSATLVYQVDRSNGIVTVSPIDITTSSGLSSLNGALADSAPVRVYGVPQSDGSLKAYVLTYFTGDVMPVQ